MRPISPRVKKIIDTDPFYKTCIFRGYQDRFGICGGRITMEHSIIFAGRQLDEAWAILPLCARHHGIEEFQDRTYINKEAVVWVALNRATLEELHAISKVINYENKKIWLNKVLGKYEHIKYPDTGEGIK